MPAGLHAAALLLCCGLLVGQSSREDAARLTGRPFQQALEQPFAATWEHVSLRTIARRIETARHTAILLDRRLDPTRERSLTADGEALHEFLDRLARDAGARSSIVGSVVYLGPPDAAGKLRTLIVLRQHELAAGEHQIPAARRHALSQPGLVAWDDLSRPGAVLQDLAGRHVLEIEGLDRVPHDLWAGALLPQVTPAEALSLILIQFDLTFEWSRQGKAIRIVPIPAEVALERGHRLINGEAPTAALERLREKFPELKAHIGGGEVLVRGTIEEHEAIERLLRPPRSGGTGATAARQRPLKLERYTLRIKDTPVRGLLRKLAEPGYGELAFDYDAEALARAGIDLDQRVTFEVKNATIEELLKAALGPLGVTFTLDGRTVHLKAK